VNISGKNNNTCRACTFDCLSAYSCFTADKLEATNARIGATAASGKISIQFDSIDGELIANQT
jgi:hypothetical protein